MTLRRTIKIDSKLAKLIQQRMDDNQPLDDDVGNHDHLYQTFTAKFGKGIESDIKIVDFPTGPWIDAVLFQDGNQIDLMEPQYVLLGEYPFEYNNVKYVVKLTTKGKKK